MKQLILQLNNRAEQVCNKYNVSLDEVADAILYGQNLKTVFNFNANKVTSFYRELLPTRLTSHKPRNWILEQFASKLCTKCNIIYPKSSFRANSSNLTGVNSFCKSCQSKGTRVSQPARQAAYRARKEERTPSWANLAKIKEFYDNCPKGMTVDHVIPLHGVLVCGLHVENNLQYLSGEDNSRKNNKFCGVA